MPGRRSRDFWRDRLLVVALVVNVIAVGLLGLISTGFVSQRSSLDSIRAETEERRDQTCVLFEREHQTEVDRLARTYAYLRTITAEDRDDAINKAVVRLLPETEQDARQSVAPAYCDAHGVGLPEPNPRIPPRPKLR